MKRPPVLYPVQVILPPTTGALLDLYPNERDAEVIRKALVLMATADGLLGPDGRRKRRQA